MRIYLAGSIFTPYERSFLADCAERLRAEGFDVFVPHEQGLVGLEATPEAVFAVDAGGVESADAVLAVLDGPSVDDGTACEIGLFYGLSSEIPSGRESSACSPTCAASGAATSRVNLFVRGCIDASGGAVVGSLDEALGSCGAGARASPHQPLSPTPSPQGIREDAGPGWPRPANAAGPGGDRCRYESNHARMKSA